jgi:hypothetical protein
MRRPKLARLPFILTALLITLLAGVTPAGAARSSPAPLALLGQGGGGSGLTCGAWHTVPSPSAHSYLNNLNGVAALSSQDIWAVGAYATNNTLAPDKTLTERWDGTQWTVVQPEPRDKPERAVQRSSRLR